MFLTVFPPHDRQGWHDCRGARYVTNTNDYVYSAIPPPQAMRHDTVKIADSYRPILYTAPVERKEPDGEVAPLDPRRYARSGSALASRTLRKDPALYVTAYCTGKRREGRIEKGMEASQGRRIVGGE
jgi:hypothetical protein